MSRRLRENFQVLADEEILDRIATLGRESKWIDIVTYGITPRGADIARMLRIDRALIGSIGTSQMAQHMSSARALASSSKTEVRLLEGCHSKLVIFHLGPKRLAAIIGSHNLGGGAPHELAVEVRGLATIQAKNYFERLWLRAQPINAVDLRKAKAHLSSASFEV